MLQGIIIPPLWGQGLFPIVVSMTTRSLLVELSLRSRQSLLVEMN